MSKFESLDKEEQKAYEEAVKAEQYLRDNPDSPGGRIERDRALRSSDRIRKLRRVGQEASTEHLSAEEVREQEMAKFKIFHEQHDMIGDKELIELDRQ